MVIMLGDIIGKVRDRVFGKWAAGSAPSSRSHRKNAFALLLVALMALLVMSSFFGYRVYRVVEDSTGVDLAVVVLMGIVLCLVVAGVIRMWWTTKRMLDALANGDDVSAVLGVGPDDDGVVGSWNGDRDVTGGG